MFFQNLLKTLMHNLINNPRRCENPSHNCTQLHNEHRKQLLLLMISDLHRTEVVFNVDQGPGGVEELLAVRSVLVLELIKKKKIGY
jgi:hypothetical protein